MRDDFKVVGIGFNKTGTTTIRRCLLILGIGPHPDRFAMNEAGLVQALVERGDTERSLNFAANYRGFEDHPWNIGTLYQDFSERYPDTRFILTVRDSESWWQSLTPYGIRDPTSRIIRLFMHQLGIDRFEKATVIAAYEDFNRNIIEYFADHPEKLLITMDLEAGDGWEKLCHFLGKPVPEYPFPRANRKKDHYSVRSRIRKRLPRSLWKLTSRCKRKAEECYFGLRRRLSS